MNKSQAKMFVREAERNAKVKARMESGDRILTFIADWLDGGTMPFPSTLMPDSEQTLEQAMREHFNLPKV